MFTQPELLLVQPPSPGSFVWFSLICSRGGGSTAAAVTLDTVADESRKKMADGVARSPSRHCSRDGKISCCHGDALSTIFLLVFVPCFLLFVFRFSFTCISFLLFSLHPGMFIFVSLRLCSSHLLLSASTYSIPGSTCSFCVCHLYPTPSRNSCGFLFVSFFCFVFSQLLFRGWRFFLLCSRTR